MTEHRAPVRLLPRASVGEVLSGRARVVGSRLDPVARRGLVSPVEARVNLGIPYADLADEERRYLAMRSVGRDLGIVVRALVTAPLAVGEAASAGVRPRIVSANVDPITIEDAVEEILATPAGERARIVHFVHPHALNLAAFDRAHRARLARADVVLPDGSGIRLAAKILGASVPHNVNGTDLLPLLCAALARTGVPLALVGAEPGVAEACAARLREDHPGLSIPLVSHGFLDDGGKAQIVGRLGALGRVVVLVGMGSPLQERFAWDHLAPLREATVVTVGGLFDFFSGRMPRAPMAWRELGLEWMYRMIQEPRRLGKRYLLGNPLFVALAVAQRLGLR